MSRNRPVRISYFNWLALLIIGFLLTCGDLYSQDTGIKYFKNYAPEEYDFPPQNWGIRQDNRGIIYVANTGGLLEFDGVTWRHISISNGLARSLAIDEAGTIYIGGKNQIGFLAPNSLGALEYISLLEHLKPEHKRFANVWRTHAVAEGIYFRTSKFLFRWNPKTKNMRVWQPGEGEALFNGSFVCGGKYYIHLKKIGLMEIKNQKLSLAPGGEKLAGYKIYIIAPYGPGTVLVGTREKGFFIFDGTSLAPFLTGADAYLKKSQLYHGIRLTSGDYALATLRGGLVVIDDTGALKQLFNKTKGLQDDDVKYVHEDRKGNLWLALNNGISKIEYASPFSLYSQGMNLTGIVLAVTRHGSANNLYVGTTSGLFMLTHRGGIGRFQAVPGMNACCWALLSVGDSLLAATSDGVFQVNTLREINRRLLSNNSYALCRSLREKGRVWVATRRGLVSLLLEKNNGAWRVEYPIVRINQEIRTLVEEKNGDLWLGTLSNGVYRIRPPFDGNFTESLLTHFNSAHGLPPKEVNVFWAAGHVMFASSKGIFRFDKLSNRFFPDSTFGELFANGSRSVFRITEDMNKNTWIHSRFENFLAKVKPEGTYKLKSKPFLRMEKTQVNQIYPDPGGNSVWFAGNNGLIRFDMEVYKDFDQTFPVHIRKVWVKGETVFEGFKHQTPRESRGQFPIIDYKDRNLRFEFTASFYEKELATRYQCLLQGYDEDWSTWTPENKKDYTNLDPGAYSFRVRAKNVYGNISSEDIFQLKILPPWYRTWWAYTIYAILIILLLFLWVKWRSLKLIKEKQALEKIIKERTKEISGKNITLQEQSEKLKEMDKVKSRFFTNISHEFRTPLTLIMGPLEQILSQTPEKEELEKKAKMMLRNSQRLLNLINQLLDLSKLDSGEMKLQAGCLDLVAFLKGIHAAFQPTAGEKNLDLTFNTDLGSIELYFDADKLEEVMTNLLSNALKFTPPGGKITTSMKKNPVGDTAFPLGWVEISVWDTGPGIPRGELTHIFDRFYQAESTYEYHQKGSGVGLAIAKELVALHHGEIEAQSGEGGGSGFIIRLPLGSAHLKAGEIAQPGAQVEEKEHYLDTVDSGPIEYPPPGVLSTDKDIILVVDDNADVREFIRGSLEPEYCVVEAEEGKEGIEKAREIIPDLIVSDVMMPGVDGYQLCRTLKNDVTTCHIAIILLTAKAAEENIIEGLETGADDYITKPFNTHILCARIKNLIDIRNQLQQNMKREMTLQPVKITVSDMDKEFIQDLHGAMDKNISDPEFNVEELCKKLYMGRSTLYRKITALSGETPNEFLRSYRLKRAAELLKETPLSVLEISFEVGFSSSSYFSKCFKKKFHQLPSQYQIAESQ